MTVNQKTKLDWVAILKKLDWVAILKRMMWPAVILLIVVVLIIFGILVPITGQTQIIELLKVVTWPAVVVFVVLIFRPAIKELIGQAETVTLEGPGSSGKVTITVRRAKVILNTMLEEIDTLIEDMKPEADRAFIEMDKGPTPVPPEFRRNSFYHHDILSVLRARHLIRPSEGGHWYAGKHIEVTPFGHLVLQVRLEKIKERALQAKAEPSMSAQWTP